MKIKVITYIGPYDDVLKVNEEKKHLKVWGSIVAVYSILVFSESLNCILYWWRVVCAPYFIAESSKEIVLRPCEYMHGVKS